METKEKRGRQTEEKPVTEKKKRGRPATGRRPENRYLSFQISREFTELREKGFSEEESIMALMSFEWWTVPDKPPKILGEEAIRAAIKESRNFGISEDDFKVSVRLQKVNSAYKDVFFYDSLTGAVMPK